MMLENLTRKQLRTLPSLKIYLDENRIISRRRPSNENNFILLESTRSDNYKTMRKRNPNLAKYVGTVCPDCKEGHLLVPTFYTLQCANPDCHNAFEEFVDGIAYPTMRRLNIVVSYIALDQKTYDLLKTRVNQTTDTRVFPYYTLKSSIKPVPTSEDTYVDEPYLIEQADSESVVTYLKPVHLHETYNAIAFEKPEGRKVFGMLVDDILDEFNDLHEQNKKTVRDLNGGLMYGRLIAHTHKI